MRRPMRKVTENLNNSVRAWIKNLLTNNEWTDKFESVEDIEDAILEKLSWEIETLVYDVLRDVDNEIHTFKRNRR